MKFAPVTFGLLLLVTPGLVGAAQPTSRPAHRGATLSQVATNAPPELIAKQLQAMLPPGSDVWIETGEVMPTGPGSGREGLTIRSDSREQVLAYAALAKELDKAAVAATLRTQAFTLKHAKADEVSTALQSLAAIRPTIDPRTNRILVVANEQELKRTQELLQMLDVPAEKPSDDATVQIFMVRHASVESLKDPLRLLNPMPGGGGRAAAWGNFALDPMRGAVIVKGNKLFIQQVEELLSRLDKPSAQTRPAEMAPQPVQIRLIWLVTTEAEMGPNEPGAPPGDLKEVLAELKKIGLKNLAMVTQNIVPAVTGEEFTIGGASSRENRPLDLRVTGALSKSDGGSPKMQLQLSVRGQTPLQTNTITDLVSLRTTVIAPLEQFVVLGVSSQTDHQDVFILQVRQSPM